MPERDMIQLGDYAVIKGAEFQVGKGWAPTCFIRGARLEADVVLPDDGERFTTVEDAKTHGVHRCMAWIDEHHPKPV